MDCQWAVYGRDDDYRSSCAKDGCVTNNRGMILGYLTETQAGSASEEFLGELEPDATGSALNALDGQDTHILTLHLDGCRLVSKYDLSRLHKRGSKLGGLLYSGQNGLPE